MNESPVTGEELLQPIAPEPAEDLVPVWLAALVLVLLLAVFAVGGYLIRDRLAGGGEQPMTAEELAVVQATAAVAAAPGDAQAHLDLGFAYQRAGKYQQALDEYDAVLGRDADNTAALYNRGVVLMSLDRPDDAETAWVAVLAISRDHVLAAKALGTLYAERKQYRSILTVVKPAADARPEMADLQVLMGIAYENTGDTRNAYARYTAALKYVPDLPEARAGLARLEGRPE